MAAILSEGSLGAIRRELKRKSEIAIAPEDVISGVRRLLNEAALNELSAMKISLPEKKRRIRKKQPAPVVDVTIVASEEQQAQADPG